MSITTRGPSPTITTADGTIIYFKDLAHKDQFNADLLGFINA